jgi:hypothetical protein
MTKTSRGSSILTAAVLAALSAAALASPPAPAPGGGAKMRLKNIHAIPEVWNGACPHEFKIEATWESLSAGEVQYTWLRSDGGTQSKPSTLTFTAANQVKTVVDTWTLGGAGFNKALWVKMKELSPYQTMTPEAKFTVNCH